MQQFQEDRGAHLREALLIKSPIATHASGVDRHKDENAATNGVPSESHRPNSESANESKQEARSSATSSRDVKPGNNSDLEKDNNEIRRSSQYLRAPASLWNWTVEIVLLVLAISFLATIGGVVAKYNEKDQPIWPYNINLNSLVALLSTLFRASLVTVLGSGQFYQSSLAVNFLTLPK